MLGNELWPVGVRPHLPGHRRLLRLQVPEEAVRCQLGDESVCVGREFGASRVAVEYLGVRHEKQEQDGRIAGESQSRPLPSGVDDDVEVASTGAVRESAGLVPDGMPLVLLELHPRVRRPRARGQPRQAGDEPRGLDAQPHLVAVVLTADRGAVNAGADLGAQQHPLLGDAPGLLRSVRVVVAGRQRARSKDQRHLRARGQRHAGTPGDSAGGVGQVGLATLAECASTPKYRPTAR